MCPSYLPILVPKLQTNPCCVPIPAPGLAPTHVYFALPVVVLQGYDAGLPDNMNQKVFIHTFNGSIWERDYNKSSLTAIGTPFTVRAQRGGSSAGRAAGQPSAIMSLPGIVNDCVPGLFASALSEAHHRTACHWHTQTRSRRTQLP